jgi:hypothetical protein
MSPLFLCFDTDNIRVDYQPHVAYLMSSRVCEKQSQVTIKYLHRTRGQVLPARNDVCF